MMTAFVRTVILYFLIMFGLRLMGKRQIGELEPSELVLTMMISDLATVPMQDFGIPLLAGVIPILTLLALSMLLSQLSLRYLRFRALVCGTPAVLIRDGTLQQEAMRKNRYTLDELLEELRGQGYTDLSAVKYAILETNGKLSVLPYAAQKPPTARQLKVSAQEGGLPRVIISDGRLREHNLKALGHDRPWVERQLARRGCKEIEQVFLLLADEADSVYLSKKDEEGGQ